MQRLCGTVFGVALALMSPVNLLRAELPDSAINLKLSAPISSWDEAVPLGNGLMGGLLWGEKNLVRLSLDRGDLWDERPAVEKDWWKKETWIRGGDWDAPYNGVTPTKLLAGRLEITLDPSQEIQSFELNLATAEGFARFIDGTKLGTFFSAASPVALICIPGPEPKSLALNPSDAKTEAGNAEPSSGGAVSRLGCPPAKHGSAGRAQWYVQEGTGGLKYCVCVESHRVDNATVIAVAVTSTKDAEEVGDNFEVTLKAGESLEAKLEKPEAIPPRPANMALPAEIKKLSQ